jgi:hypothetical protein
MVSDGQLVEWGRNPGGVRDHELEPPTAAAVHQACLVAIDLRDAGELPPSRVVPNGDGGIVFELTVGQRAVTLEFFDDGSIERTCYDGCRMLHRETIR